MVLSVIPYWLQTVFYLADNDLTELYRPLPIRTTATQSTKVMMPPSLKKVQLMQKIASAMWITASI